MRPYLYQNAGRGAYGLPATDTTAPAFCNKNSWHTTINGVPEYGEKENFLFFGFYVYI